MRRDVLDRAIGTAREHHEMLVGFATHDSLVGKHFDTDNGWILGRPVRHALGDPATQQAVGR
ncbi:MAG: hypothetical protein R3B96_14110 [Pirellulaceae bacterium]